MDHLIAEGREYWDRHAQIDPMWAVLSDPGKSGGKWNLQEFMANGEREIALLWHQLARLGLIPARGAALDFGCGIGRLTQALARRFDHVVGVDISPSMIALAREVNQYPSNAEYLCNSHADLRDLASCSCDFIYSNIVLQHVEPQLTLEYLKEFFRLLRPGGVLVFQLPSHLDTLGQVTIRPMPADAYQAGIELTGSVATGSAPSELFASVRVTNTSSHEWRQRESGSIRVGNHWFDSTGQFMVIQDDGREVLPQIMSPGESCDVVLTMAAPTAPGSYQGEIDVVHEGVTWFRDRGSQAVRFDFTAGEQGAANEIRSASAIHEYAVPAYPGERLPAFASAGNDRPPGQFPMHGVPRTQVVELIGQQGGAVVHLEDGHRAGVEWVDYRYFVRAATK